MSLKQSSVADFIQALQKAKAAQAAWSVVSPADKITALSQSESILKENAAGFAGIEADHQGLPIKFVEQVTINRTLHLFQSVIAELKEASEESFGKVQATGLISVILPKALSLRFALEMILPALAAGNAVIVKTSSQSQGTGDILRNLFASFPEGLVSVLDGSRESLGDLFSGHPSIKAVAFCGQSASAEKIAKSAIATFKKLKLYMAGSNSALVLDGVDLDQVAEQLCMSCFTGAGGLRESISKVLVLESMQEAFFAAFKKAAEKFLKEQSLNLNPKQKEKLQALLSQVPTDSGKVAWGDQNSVAIIKDLSHCSVMQQDALHAPMAIVSAVKYQHEMVKWANTGYLGVCAQIFGPTDKALKVAQKLEVSKVYINSWLPQEPALSWGLKSSSYGVADSKVFGGFFSESKIFVGI